ncbi:hypothetical protein [Sphingomonas solaris]|uniref:Uncharacterized protein n=1 Tax=Alterirhizorhabdus solaris TaxID=2529389 RepID=A0A558QS11_9SPHN|nr:hypothetical protein [Sphingomonas solaris]TVV69837.1 hypothetical protein FOY91_20650 [Sphingomonas solaris]
MANILELLQRELDVAATEGTQPVSWELSTEALASLKAAEHEKGETTEGHTALGLPVIESDVPGFAILLNTKPS